MVMRRRNVWLLPFRRLGEFSSKWTTFGPVFVSKVDLIAYEESSQHWRSIPTLSFLPENHLTKTKHSQIKEIRGALLLIVTKDLVFSTKVTLSVANVLTRTWKLLPPVPRHDWWIRFDNILVSDTETYKVIVLGTCEDPKCSYLAEIYDSHFNSWSNVRLPEDKSKGFSICITNGVYLDGVLYKVGCSYVDHRLKKTPWLLALNLKESTFKLLEMVPTDINFEVEVEDDPIDLFTLVVCNGSLLLVIQGDIIQDSVIVVEADLDLLRWLKVSQGPPTALKIGNIRKGPTSNGNCIYLQGENRSRSLTYNVQTDEWSSLLVPAIVRRRDHRGREEYQFDPSSFQPGLNPFVAV